jgi:uncharacterized protein
MDLPDVNVWLALMDENHLHHEAAIRYWQNASADQVAFTRVSMMGVLRLSTHPKILSRPLTIGEAWEAYQSFLALTNTCYLQEPLALDVHFRALSTGNWFTHRLWTDAYLAPFAIAQGARLVSFDSDFSKFQGLNLLHLRNSDC